MPHTWDEGALHPRAALDRLIEGNRRFLTHAGTATLHAWTPSLAESGQRPFAIILGCSDSRTPVEILFDQGFGELFVVRVAGNIVAPSLVGSIEFAASQFGTRLVVVMGHTRCGAVAAAVSALETGHGPKSRNIRSITDRIEPHVADLVLAHAGGDRDKLLREAVRANVHAVAAQLRHGSSTLQGLIRAGRVAVVGAVYELETGLVHFIDGVPRGADRKPGARGEVAPAFSRAENQVDSPAFGAARGRAAVGRSECAAHSRPTIVRSGRSKRWNGRWFATGRTAPGPSRVSPNMSCATRLVSRVCERLPARMA